MRRFSIPIIPDENGVSHDSTTWQVAEDIGFNNILFEEDESVKYKVVYFSPVNLSPDDLAYVRMKLHYSDGTASDWSDVVRILPYVETDNRDNVILNVVELPIVTVSNDLFDKNATEFTIETSKIRTLGSWHKATSYIIKDERGVVIFKSLMDTVNLTTISIDKQNMKLSKTNKLSISVMHHNGNDGASKASSDVFYIGDYNFTKDTDTNDVSLDNDVTIDFTWNANAEYAEFDKIELIDDINNEVKVYNDITTSLTIDNEELKDNHKYTLRLYPRQRIQDDVCFKDYLLTTK